jgi:hypothetical protein
MKVLFTSHLPPHIAHEIPLLALDKLLENSGIETAFLAPSSEHEFLRRMGAQVLNVDHIGFRTEMEAYGEFAPDVVIDDASFTTGFATTLSKIPRIAIPARFRATRVTVTACEPPMCRRLFSRCRM